MARFGWIYEPRGAELMVCFCSNETGKFEVLVDGRHVSTSVAERQNLTMRIRRFTRLTNAFSKKLENHALSVALHYMNYNFCRIHKTLRVTPAMAAGVTDRVWDMKDVAALITAQEAPVAKRGPYRKKAA